MLACQQPPKIATSWITYYGDREVLNMRTVAGKRMYKQRTFDMAGRQGFTCAICGRLLVEPRFDHQDGRGMNGAHRDDRIVDGEGNWINAALDDICNNKKGSKRYVWINELYLPISYAREN